MRLRGARRGGQWRNEELSSFEDGPPQLDEYGLEIVARSYKATTGVGYDGFRGTVLLVLPKATTRETVKFLENVYPCGRWPQQARTTMFFLIPKNVSSRRPIALRPTLIRWLRALEVSNW